MSYFTSTLGWGDLLMRENESNLESIAKLSEKRKLGLVDIFSAPCAKIEDKKEEAMLVGMLLSKFDKIASDSSSNEKNKIWKS